MNLQSKKLKATIVAVMLEVVRMMADAVTIDSIQMDGSALDESIRALQMILGTYVIGQGVADVGKERAKVEKGIK